MNNLFKGLALTALLFLSLLSAPSEAANTATKIGTIPIIISGNLHDAEVFLVAYDTINTDLLIKAGATGATTCSAGVFLSESTSQNVSFKLDSTNYVTLKLAAYQGIYDKLSNSVSFCTVPGQSLQFKSTGLMGSMLIYVIQSRVLRFGGN